MITSDRGENHGVCDEAIDMMSKMICPENRRWTASQLMTHKWLATTDPSESAAAPVSSVKPMSVVDGGDENMKMSVDGGCGCVCV